MSGDGELDPESSMSGIEVGNGCALIHRATRSPTCGYGDHGDGMLALETQSRELVIEPGLSGVTNLCRDPKFVLEPSVTERHELDVGLVLAIANLLSAVDVLFVHAVGAAWQRLRDTVL